jgi:hypothetical protein
VRNLNSLSKDLVLQGFLAQNPLEFTDALLKNFDLRGPDDFLIDPDRFLPPSAMRRLQ